MRGLTMRERETKEEIIPKIQLEPFAGINWIQI